MGGFPGRLIVSAAVCNLSSPALCPHLLCVFCMVQLFPVSVSFSWYVTQPKEWGGKKIPQNMGLIFFLFLLVTLHEEFAAFSVSLETGLLSIFFRGCFCFLPNS